MVDLSNPIHGKISAIVGALIIGVITYLYTNPTILTSNLPATYTSIALLIIGVLYSAITPGVINNTVQTPTETAQTVEVQKAPDEEEEIPNDENAA
jgi:hypothetical protein